MKKALTWSWTTVHTKRGTTYERRQRKKIKTIEPDAESTKAARKEEWDRSVLYAGLKDRLGFGLKYNGSYYDHRGNQIFVPEKFKDIVAEHLHSKNNSSTFEKFYTGTETDIERKQKDKLIGLIKLKDKLFNQELKKKIAFHDKLQAPETIQHNIASYLKSIHKDRSNLDDMLFALNYVRRRIDDSIDPTVEVKYEDKLQEIPLSEAIERMTKNKAKDPTSRKNTGIQSLSIKYLEDYNDEDFKKEPFELTQLTFDDITNRVNKKYSKLGKGISEEDLFYKGLKEELGIDLRSHIEADDYDFIVIEKGKKVTLIRKTKMIHRGGKTFFATYWINPFTGEKTDNIKDEIIGSTTYEGHHDEFGTGDAVKFFNKKKGIFETGVVKRVLVDKKYPEGILILRTDDDPEITISLKSARAIIRIKSVTEKERDVTEKITGKEINPDDITDLIIRDSRIDLGGSSDVKMYKSTVGKSFVVKTSHKGELDQLKNEKLADDLYKIMGFTTPESFIGKLDGKDVKISEFIPNTKTLRTLLPATKKRIHNEIKKGFVFDALMGNWDVIGSAEDNILYNLDNDEIIRIDNGGSMFYRARGGKKEFEPEITELKTFLDEGKNPITASVYAGITEEEILTQAKDILTKEGDLVNLLVRSEGTDHTLSKAFIGRLKYLREYVKNLEKPKAPEYDYDKSKYSSKTTADFFEKGWDEMEVEGNPGIKEHIKAKILEIEKDREDRGTYKKFAVENGISVEQWKKKAQEITEKFVGDSNFFRATDISYLNHILLKDKRFKNQFEVARSDGSYDPDYRADIEHKYFGFKNDKDHEKDKRPIYGYFSDHPYGIQNENGEHPPENYCSGYGHVTIKMKKSIALKKATVTCHDSLNSGVMISCFAAKPHFTMMSYGGTDIVKYPPKSSRHGFQRSYTEVQYHNQFKLEDVEEIIFSTKNFLHGEAKGLEQMNRMIDIARKTDIPIKIY